MKLINTLKVIYNRWLLKKRLRQYQRLVKVLNITTEFTAGMKIGNLDVLQWATTEGISDALMSNLISESHGLGSIGVVEYNENFNPLKPTYEDINWNETKSSAMLIDELYQKIIIKLASNPHVLKNMIQYEIKQDLIGQPTHIVFKLITVKTK